MDSPLANEATAIFLQCDVKCLDEEARALVDSGINPLTFSGLKLAVSTDESVAINFDEKPKVIISSSGMCEAGRIRHHLKHLSLIHISEPTRRTPISYAVFCLKKKKTKT